MKLKKLDRTYNRLILAQYTQIGSFPQEMHNFSFGYPQNILDFYVLECITSIQVFKLHSTNVGVVLEDCI